MKKFGRKPTDDQMLEGGGAGSAINGGLGGRKVNAALAAAAAPMLAVPFMPAYVSAKKKADKEQREGDAEMKRESRGKSLSTQEQEMVQEMKDEKMRKRMKTAPTTKTEMGEPFAKGGKVSSASRRADGCAQRGKTRGMMV